MATTPSPLPHDPTRPPSCSWRGLLIDSARTFWTVPVMELIITVMARYRLNVLHWHLTDNAGWRIPVPGYPALTSIGAQIPRAPEDWYDHACAPERSGTWRTSPARTSQGFYSDANIRHLVRFAAQRNIRIIPEISIPSCAGAAIRAYPHLGNPPSPMHPYRNTTRRYGPSPHLSTSSRQPSTTCATYSPPPLFISAHPKPIGVRGKMTHTRARRPDIWARYRAPIYRTSNAHTSLPRSPGGHLGHRDSRIQLPTPRNNPSLITPQRIAHHRSLFVGRPLGSGRLTPPHTQPSHAPQLTHSISCDRTPAL